MSLVIYFKVSGDTQPEPILNMDDTEDKINECFGRYLSKRHSTAISRILMQTRGTVRRLLRHVPGEGLRMSNRKGYLLFKIGSLVGADTA